MSSNECTICKHYGRKTTDLKNLERTTLYDDMGNPVGINLCRKHSVDLFQMGQRKFLMGHYRILVDILSSDEPKFISLLEKTVKNNIGQIY